MTRRVEADHEPANEAIHSVTRDCIGLIKLDLLVSVNGGFGHGLREETFHPGQLDYPVR
jgi:hypothetical protein